MLSRINMSMYYWLVIRKIAEKIRKKKRPTQIWLQIRNAVKKSSSPGRILIGSRFPGRNDVLFEQTLKKNKRKVKKFSDKTTALPLVIRSESKENATKTNEPVFFFFFRRRRRRIRSSADVKLCKRQWGLLKIIRKVFYDFFLFMFFTKRFVVSMFKNIIIVIIIATRCASVGRTRPLWEFAVTDNGRTQKKT